MIEKIGLKSRFYPAHKQRMLWHFRHQHEVLGPIEGCTCGICQPSENYNWDGLAERLIDEVNSFKGNRVT